MSTESITGHLLLRPGRTPSVVCERPMVGAALLERLTAGRRAVLLPELLAAVFTLCADAQRSTARRAVRSALGTADSTAEAARDARSIALHVVREHLQRFALDLPAQTVAGSSTVAPHWLRESPLMALRASAGGSDTRVLQSIARALPGWLESRLFGMAPHTWLEAWQAERGAWLGRWSEGCDHPLAQWLLAVRRDAQAIAWPCRAFDPLQDPTASGLRAIPAALARDPAFASHPVWEGAPAETGPWTRHAGSVPVATAWDRLGARLADIAHIATAAEPPLALGAMTLADGEGIAWTEMARGLLIHWVRLEPGARDAATARAARYHVLAPTEWNFHADGALARWLRHESPQPAQVRLAAATLDPCLAFSIEEAAQHA